MPLKYVIEMVMDRIAASKIYKGKDYTDASPWEYYARGKDYLVMHPETRALLERLLLMFKKAGRAENICLYPPSAAAGQLLKRASGAGEADPIQNIPQILERQLRIRLSAGI